MPKPLVTVLMPVYNAERFLSEAIDSILNQTLTNFEFLIIDDGSSDSSLQIIRSYNDPRIRLIQNEKNMGISATLNKGINLASADLIARMDADDISYPERLQKQYDYLSSHPDCALLSTQARVVTEDKQPEYIDNTNSDYFYYNLTFSSPIFHPSVMYRKDAVQDVGMYTVPYSEDFELFWHLTRKYKLYNLPEVLLDYRNNSESLHQVNKKTEYSLAAYNQTLRNLRFYAGENYTISENCVKSLQYDFDPLLQEKSITNIKNCIRQLDFITRCILNTENVNRDVKNIKAAALYKRKLMLSIFVKKLSRRKSTLLLLNLGEFKILIKQLKNILRKRLPVII
jgi:glycosyltransferase involved in cell wall biosynthesis